MSTSTHLDCGCHFVPAERTRMTRVRLFVSTTFHRMTGWRWYR